MSVQWFHELWKDRSATVSDNNGNLEREYVRVFQVRTNNKNDDATVIAAYESCPLIGDEYPNDPSALVSNLQFDNLEQEPESWYVTATYSTNYSLDRLEGNPQASEGNSPTQENKDQKATDPEQYPTEYTSTLEPYEELLIVDKEGRKVTTSSNEPFDPPLTYTAYLINMTVTKRVPLRDYSLLTGILDMGAVNSKHYMGFAPGTSLLAGQSATLMQEKGEVFWRISTTIKIKPNKMEYDTEAGNGKPVDESAWQVWVYDYGFCELVNGEQVEILDARTGVAPANPKPLDGNGTVAAEPAILKFQPHLSLNFGGLSYL